MQYLAIIEAHLPGSTPVGGCGCKGKWPRTLCAVAPIGEAVLTPGDPSPAGRCPCCDGLVYLKSGAVLVANTTRACYWRSPFGCYVASGPDESPPSGTGGYPRLDSLMRLKGEPGEVIRRVCDDSGQARESGK